MPRRSAPLAKTPIERILVWFACAIMGVVITVGIPTIAGVALLSWADLKVLKNDVAYLRTDLGTKASDLEKRVTALEQHWKGP